MNVTKYSRNRFLETLNKWDVPRDYADPVYNYLVHGLSPGSFFTAVLSNNFAGAMIHSHPANAIPALKNLVGWMEEYCPGEAWGDYNSVTAWRSLAAEQRRSILESQGLIYTEQQEVMLALKNEPTVEPFFMN